MPGLLGRVYRIFREGLREDLTFDEEMRRQIMRHLNTAILDAQDEFYEELTKIEP